MRCTNSYFEGKRILSTALILCMLFSMTACGKAEYEMAYSTDMAVSGFSVVDKQESGMADGFATGLCVVTDDVTENVSVDMENAHSAVLFDVTNNEVIYSKNAHDTLYPASLTKVMTALVALKYGSMDQMLVASNNVNISESGAQLCGLKQGDRMTLNQALYILLMYSANDVAMLIAENVGGSVEHFVELMNEEAKVIGATNSNFVNPHGLSADDHYTTAYDLYLIFNEALKQDGFLEIISTTNYETSFTDKNGKAKQLSFQNSNLYLRGNYTAPENVTIVGGKTGTTNAAGHCLMLLTKDNAGNPYISIVLRSESRDLLYTEMSDLLDEISK